MRPPPRWSVLVMLLALSLAAQEPVPTTRLVYDLPARELRDTAAERAQTVDQLVDGAVATVRRRLDDACRVTRTGTGFIVDLAGTQERVAEVRRRVESAATLELRVVATDDFQMDGVSFDLAEEKRRLADWLQQGGRVLVRGDYKQIARFNDDPGRGPKAFGHLRWYPHLVRPQPGNEKAWGGPYSLDTGLEGGVMPLAPATVAVFDQATEWNAGRVPESMAATGQPFLLEFVAVNTKERCFRGDDLDPAGVQPGAAGDGRAAVHYKLKDELCAEYADWSQKYIKKHSAIILNGVITSAPYFVSRIPGRGQISGQFTELEVQELASRLQAGDLPLRPVLLRQEPASASK